MTPRAAFAELLRRHAEVRDLSSATALLAWDQETMMPRKAAAARASQLATLAGLRHERFTDPRLGDWIAACEAASGEFDDEERAGIRELARDWRRATQLPRDLVEEQAAAESAALEAWREARARSDWPAFAPHLERLLDLARRRAAVLGFADRPYDGLLDDYERGATEAGLAQLFDQLVPRLAPMVAIIVEHAGRVDSRCFRQPFDERAQEAFATRVVAAMGFDTDAGRIDRSSHPFCTGIARGDVRLTRRFAADDLRPALFGIVHEAGHGLYEQGLHAAGAAERPGAALLAEACSLGVHESQSRLWENIVARSLPFWQAFAPVAAEYFPAQLAAVGAEECWRAVNEVQRSLIRVEADELTYNLHVAVRFDVERALVAGRLAVADVPAAWNAAMQRLIGLAPGNDGEGCLQDIHWAMGGLGYFPTYTLGNLYAAQLWETAQRELPRLDEAIAQGELVVLRDWLRASVHCHGRRFTASELIERATGAPPSSEPFVRHLRARFGAVYGVTLPG
ncbi:MAG: carboxypeptidase M32 [Planctomycetes bacterium]|nr:carboxypeptidase M32 [Planctomycetota bacterium]